VTWLFDRQLRMLANFVDGCVRALKAKGHDDGEDAGGMSMQGAGVSYRAAYLTAFAKLTDMEGAEGALMGMDRFEFRYTKTLLRVDVFGGAQNKITQTLKDLNGDRPKLPIKDIRAALPVENEDHYILVKNIYAAIREHIRETILASIDHFAEKLAVMKKPSEHDSSAVRVTYSAKIRAVMMLINRVAPPATLKYFIDQVKTTKDDNLESEQRYWSSIEDRGCAAVVEAYRGNTEAFVAAYRGYTGIAEISSVDIAEVNDFIRDVKRAKNKRRGFKAEDHLEPLIRNAFVEATPALIVLLDELDTLNEEIDKTLHVRAEAFKDDHQKFAQAFEEIYGD
jgi:hypothetical protein